LFLNLSMGQLLCLPMLFFGIYLLAHANHRKQRLAE
jgi:prolipoprotein diacylglyceryltransferase